MAERQILVPSTHQEVARDLKKRALKTMGVNDSTAILRQCVEVALNDLRQIQEIIDEHSSFKDPDLGDASTRLLLLIERLEFAHELDGGLYDPEKPEQTLRSKIVDDSEASK